MRAVHKVSPLREGTPMSRNSSSSALTDMDDGTGTPMLFDLEDGCVSEQGTAVDPTTRSIRKAASETVQQLQWLLQSNSDAEQLLKLHVKVARDCAPNQQLDPETLSMALQRAGYTTKLHSPSGNKLRGLRHQYLTVCLPDGSDSGSSNYIVDPNFRDSFEVAHPTPRYSAVLDSVSHEVVATKACLRRAVTVLSRELARSFTEQGSPVPPWRTQSALLSKWELQHTAAGCGEPLLGGWALNGTPAFGKVS